MILIFSIGQSMAADITSKDFAAGYYLEVDNKSAVYSLELPEDVYHMVRSADLRDVRVFNGSGEVVPHEFRTVQTDQTTLRDKKTLPFFPLFLASMPSNMKGISLEVSRDTAGAIVNIKSDPAGDKDQQEITGYLLDLSGLKQAVAELEFHWKKDMDSSVFTVNIEQSDDLVRWTPLVYKATLADLQFGGQEVEKRTIELPRQPLKYLKLTWQESRWPLKLTEVASFFRSVAAPGKHRWVSVENGNLREENGQFMVDFETSYRLPTTSAQIHFSETNSIARLSIQSRPSIDTAWSTRCEQVFHDLSYKDATLQNEPCEFQSTSDPLWRVVIKQDGAGLGSGKRLAALQLGWQPSELLFMGRGTPPYLLAFGSGKLAQGNQDSSAGMLLMAMQVKKSGPEIAQAKLGKRIDLGGDLALRTPAKPTPWKTWLLWLVLVMGVGLVALMTRSLLKEMKLTEEKNVPGER